MKSLSCSDPVSCAGDATSPATPAANSCRERPTRPVSAFSLEPTDREGGGGASTQTGRTQATEHT
ncbi:unnamed protein product [Ectocarpus sp. CCAP 1310/34]|nr:unnamed protein product [Ectocarpus sp. CCAP 1310/34]